MASALAVFVLVTAAVTARAGECEARSHTCADLAERVAQSCPRECTSRHCSLSCIPPLADDGRCGICQEHCAHVCDSQVEARRQACGLEHRDCADGRPATD